MQCHLNQLKTTNLEFVTFVGNRLENIVIMVGRSAQAAEPFSEDQCKANIVTFTNVVKEVTAQ